jgi:hypothetical protein
LVCAPWYLAETDWPKQIGRNRLAETDWQIKTSW